MFEVDRVAALIRPTVKMLEWLNKHPSKYDNMTLKNLQKDCLTLLIPAFDGPRQSLEYVKQLHRAILKSELISWGVPKTAWPKDLSLELFNDWFNVEFHSVIYDVAYLEENEKAEQSA